MAGSRSRGEEELTRLTMRALSQAFPSALVLRNEANALTSFLVGCRRALQPYPFAIEVVEKEYRKIPEAIRYGLGVGSADLLVCYEGRFKALEMKTEDGVQSPAQVTWGGWVRRAGGVYEVVRSEGEALEVVRG